jgi:glutamate synthase domain-containing protein 1
MAYQFKDPAVKRLAEKVKRSKAAGRKVRKQVLGARRPASHAKTRLGNVSVELFDRAVEHLGRLLERGELREKRAAGYGAAVMRSKRKRVAKKVPVAPEHFPKELASDLGYTARRPKKKATKRRKSAKRAARSEKKTKAQIHAERVKQGKRLAALRKEQLAQLKGKRGKRPAKKKGSSRKR